MEERREKGNARERVILHCDCNSFFASVETVLHPAYRGVPMAVCGAESERHGIVLAKNELAKQYGIETAETVYSARRKCPSLVIAEPHYDAYVDFSRRIGAIYDRFTDLVEPFSIDECWLDVTGSQALFGDGRQIADTLRRLVQEETGVTISVGVSFNKIFAKIGSDYKKPDATTVITRENYPRLLFPMPIEALMFVGQRTAQELHAVNIRTIGDLAHASPAFLSARLGKLGMVIHAYANGQDESPVRARDDRTAAKSVGNGMTFRRDIETVEEIRLGLSVLCEEIGARLRLSGQKATVVSVAVKDTLLHTVSRQQGLAHPTSLGRELADAAYAIMLREWRIGRPIRALTVTAMQLRGAEEGGEQISLFDTEGAQKREKNARLEETMDRIRGRYGRGAISSGAAISSDLGLVSEERRGQPPKSPKDKG